MGRIVNPSQAELQVHDLLLDSNPDQHSADCSICKNRAPATDVEDPTVDELAQLQAQIAQLSSDLEAERSTIADLRQQLSSKDSEAELTTVKAERDQAVADKETADAALDALRTEFANYRQGIEDLAAQDAETERLAALAVSRAAEIKDLGYSEAFVNAEGRAAGWAALDDAAWDVRKAELTETKPTAAPTPDPAANPADVAIPGATPPATPPAPTLDADGNPIPPVSDADQGGDFRSFLRDRAAVARV